MSEGSDLGSVVVRRVVTGPTADGRGGVVRDETLRPSDDLDVELTELWRTEDVLRSALEGGDPARDPWQMIPAAGGLAWRLVRWTESSPQMHQTDTLDLLLVIDGRIDLELETGRVRLEQGDSVVIQDALHCWHLVDEVPCTAVALMLRPAPDAG